MPTHHHANPRVCEELQWRAWVREGDDERGVLVYCPANECRHEGMTTVEWIMERLEKWPSDNWDKRSHLHQLMDASPIRVYPQD